MTALSQILESKIVAIIRGARPEDVLKIAEALKLGGVAALEITLNSSKALLAIEEITDKMGDKVIVGAGTVLDAHAAREAISAGARFIISPCLDVKTIRTTRRYGAVSIPGAYTPTEVLNAYSYGGDIIKVFPASNARYIKDIRAPLSQIPLMPTGGVNLDNIAEFYKAGVVAFGIGSALVDTRDAITDAYLQKLTETARQFVRAVSH